MCREWQVLNQSQVSCQIVARWARQQPALKGCSSVGDIYDAIDTGAERHPREDGIPNLSNPDSDRIMNALLYLAQNKGEKLAERVIHQVMLPSLGRILNQSGITGHDNEGLQQLGEFLHKHMKRAPHDQANTYSRLRMRVVKEWSRHLKKQRAIAAHEVVTDDMALLPAPREVETTRARIYAMLIEEKDAGRISELDYQLIVGKYLDKHRSAELAADHGLSADAVRQRCHRTIVQLAKNALNPPPKTAVNPVQTITLATSDDA